jgi:O-antigen/teichoic acid export membrane protein
VVKENLGISELGYYSLAYSFSAIFTQIIAAIAVVFFPLFKRINEKRATIILADIDFLISAVGVISLILYYPGYLLIKNIFPNFLESLGCILYIIPIVICQARISIVYNTIYKVLLMQKQMVVTVLIAVIFCLVATQVAFEIYPTKEAVMGMAYISYVIWITATLAILHKKKNIRSSILSIDIVVSMLFVMINLHFGFSWRAFIISIILILVALIININKLINCFRGVKIAMDSA